MPLFLRDQSGPDHGEMFLISAVITIIGVRAFLSLTGYPQLGGNGLHIAHMLWGGLLMTLAIVIFISFINRQTKWLASLIGGVGFGLFIDEVGKFVTADNNYFFQPAFAIMYGVFLVVFFGLQFIQEKTHYSPKEEEINQEIEKFSQVENSPIIIKFNMLHQKMLNLIYTFSKTHLFGLLVIGYFLFNATAGLLANLMVAGTLTLIDPLKITLTTFDYIEFFVSSIYTIVVLVGSFHFFISRKRLSAYIIFRYATYYSIFVLQFFAFFRNQLLAIINLFLSLLILNTIKYLEQKEKLKLKKS